MTITYYSGFYPNSTDTGVLGTTKPIVTPSELEDIQAGVVGLSDDSIISINEKITSLIPDVATLTNQWQQLNAAASTINDPAVNNARNNAANAKVAWDTYLGNLSPSYDDTSAPTTIGDRTTFNNVFSTLIYSLNALFAALDVYGFKAANWPDIIGTGKPEDNATKNNDYFYDSFDYESTTDFTNKWGPAGGAQRVINGEVSIVSSSTTPGGTYIKIGNNSGNDYAQIIAPRAIPYQSEDLYEVGFEVEFGPSDANARFYLGVRAENLNGDNLITDEGTFAYSAVSGSLQTLNSSKKVYRGYFRGLANVGAGNNVGRLSTNRATPLPLPTGTVAVRPVMLLNYNNISGTAIVHQAWCRKVEDTFAIPTGPWSSTRSYYRDESVTYQGRSFGSIANGNLNNTPPTTGASNAFWYLIADKGADGSPGLSNALVYAYQRSAAGAPAQISSTASYDFSTKTLTNLNNGWSASIPGGTDVLYITAATASSTGTVDTIGPGEWSSPVVFSQSGGSGNNGFSAASIYLYKRAPAGTAPAVPSTLSTYTFSSGVLANHNNGWSQTIPAVDGQPLWYTTATAISTAATDDIPTGEWASPRIILQDGAGLITFTKTPSVTFDAGTMTIQCTSSTGWGYEGVYSNQKFIGGCLLTFKAPRPFMTQEFFMFGLNENPSDSNNYTDIDNAIFFRHNGTIYEWVIYENGSTVSNTPGGPTVRGTWNISDVFTIRHDETKQTITYYVNGVEKRVQYNVPVGKQLAIDGVFANKGTITDIGFSPAGSTGQKGDTGDDGASTFTLLPHSNVSIGIDWIEKISGGEQWNASAYSAEAYVGGCSASYTITASTYIMFGISTLPGTDEGYNNINYALFQHADGTVYKYESGTGAAIGTWSIGDVLQVHYDGKSVRYLKNGTVMNTTQSGVVADMKFSLDTSIYSVSGRINKIKWTGSGGVGAAGTPGYNNAPILIFKRSATLPAAPSINATYTFSTKTLANLNNGWSVAFPAENGQPVYISGAYASSQTDTDLITPGEWSTPVIHSQSGTNGGPGTGAVPITLYKRAPDGAAPSGPTLDVTVTMATAASTDPGNGWTRTFPSVNGQPAWATTAMAVSTGSTDTILTTEWPTAVKILKDGDNGQDGYTISPPSVAWSIASSQNGTPDAGELPRSVTFKVMKGNTNITADASTVFTLSTPTGFTGSLGGANNSVLTVTSVTSDAPTATITVTVSGNVIGIIEVKMTKLKRGAAQVQFSSGFTLMGNTSTYVQTASIDLNLPAGGKLEAEAEAVYSTTGSSYTPQVKLTYQNITDAGQTESDFTGSNPTTGDTAFLEETAAIYAPTVNTIPGNTSAKLYRVRLYSRRSAGTGNSSGVSGTLYARTG